MQKLGQHFLKNIAVLRTIVESVDVQENETVVEIGPGHGELTTPLALAAEQMKAAVISVEKDRTLATELIAESAQNGPTGVLSIIEGDALKILPGLVAPLGDFKIAGNIPYYITGKLLRVISELETQPIRTVLLVQKEVAERICAESPAMNRLAASVQFWAEPKIVAVVPREDFSPPPDVTSAVIVLDRKGLPGGVEAAAEAERYYRAVRAIFAQPRKTLLNNLSESTHKSAARGDIAAELQKMDIDPHDRPHDLTIMGITRIAHAFF